MHDDQLVSDAELVRELLRDRHPHWADGPITEISSTGTDHALYRLGEDAALLDARTMLTQALVRVRVRLADDQGRRLGRDAYTRFQARRASPTGTRTTNAGQHLPGDPRLSRSRPGSKPWHSRRRKPKSW